ncbi:O-antigen ligase family protein [Cohnella lubricantis]|uniref:O-antigen ligase family protein n=1 Tax=Cohnella lubricantis TaxID=2163172 RepID=A0A841THQ5_9BACL|nr:O-antigen ligase family protein [Cohnella lubricantis]MBB6678768.1 O-antigen ligase family protein [Cohnella lubricantis]MBP2117852.1 O-antigen ligase [Cohnella lubricantis]
MKAKQQVKSKKVNAAQTIPAWGWAIFALLALFSITWPFQYGFFNGAGLHSMSQFYFEKKLYYGVLFAFPAFVLAIVKFARKEALERRHLLAIAGLILPIMYMIGTWHAESAYLARNTFYSSLTLYAFFILGILIADQPRLLQWIIRLYFGIGSILVIVSFSYLLGNKYLLDALSFGDGVRLTSVFTYANAYAAFLLTLLLIALFEMTRDVSRNVKLLYGFMLVPIVTSLLLTLSRGAMLMLPIVAIIALLLVGMRRQVWLLVYFVLALLISLAIQSDLADRGIDVYNRIQQQMAAGQPVSTVGFFASTSIGGWIRLLIAALVMTAFVYVAERFDRRTMTEATQKRFGRLLIPFVLVIVSIVGAAVLKAGWLNSLLPAQLEARIGNLTLNTHSVLERFVFYKDSIKMWKLHPIIGGGGGTWEALYDTYQMYPYLSAQPHSYLFELLLDTGLIGIVIIGGGIIALIASYLFRYFKNRLDDRENTVLYALIPISVLLHSLIDFEMSYLFFGLLVFFCLGVLAGQHREPILNEQKLAVHFRIRGGTAAVWGVLLIYLIVVISNSFSANSNLYKSATWASQQKPLEELVEPLTNGLKKVSDHPFIYGQLINYYLTAYQQTNDQQYSTLAHQYIDELKKAEPHFRITPRLEISLAELERKTDEEARLIDEAIANAPFDVTFYEEAIQTRYQLWTQYSEVGDEENKQKQADAIKAIADAYTEKSNELKKVPKAITIVRPFVLSEDALTKIGNVQP